MTPSQSFETTAAFCLAFCAALCRYMRFVRMLQSASLQTYTQERRITRGTAFSTFCFADHFHRRKKKEREKKSSRESRGNKDNKLLIFIFLFIFLLIFIY
jgi:hypothetical protein